MSVPVVLLHPLGVDHGFWDPVRDALPDAVGQVITPDLLGHGSAPTPGAGTTVEHLADAVEAEIARQRKVHLVGVSLGGLVAQVIAARSPDLVERVVLADAVAVYPEPMRVMWRERAAAVRAGGLESVVEPMETLWFSEGFRSRQADRVATVRAMLLSTDPEGYASACDALAVADTTAVVDSIRAPLLAACGIDDAPLFRTAAEWFERTVPGARAVWLTGRHATTYEHPTVFAALLADFFR